MTATFFPFPSVLNREYLEWCSQAIPPFSLGCRKLGGDNLCFEFTALTVERETASEAVPEDPLWVCTCI